MLMDFPEEGLWLIGRMAEKLMSRNMRLGTAESCTGGLASVLCTNISGSSRWFSGGVVAYADHVKTGLLGVEADLIAAYGAVSGPVVEAMARGALAALRTDLALAVSGIAGPDGGAPGKPVGTVWIATAVVKTPTGAAQPQDVRVYSFGRQFPGDRLDVRFAAALAALGAADAALDGL